MNLRGFATLNLWADDVEAARDWYAALLGTEAYFTRPGPDGRTAYAEFRLGDHADELGIIDRRFQPAGAATVPGGAVMHWHVDDLDAAVEQLLAMGAEEYLPITRHGDLGFATASVVDPFGNVLGVMYNPHFVEIVASLQGS
jgi:predicted enzyme related to lactoylglutathione lyase